MTPTVVFWIVNTVLILDVVTNVSEELIGTIFRVYQHISITCVQLSLWTWYVSLVTAMALQQISPLQWQFQFEWEGSDVLYTVHTQSPQFSFRTGKGCVTYKKDGRGQRGEDRVWSTGTAQSVFQSMERICIEQGNVVQFTLRWVPSVGCSLLDDRPPPALPDTSVSPQLGPHRRTADQRTGSLVSARVSEWLSEVTCNLEQQRVTSVTVISGTKASV